MGTGVSSKRFGSRAALLGVVLVVAALVGAMFAVADTGSAGCGYGGYGYGYGYGDPAYCEPTGSATLSGRILQDGTDAPLQYANVVVRDASGRLLTTTTDRTGSFAFTGLPGGQYTVYASRYGHAPQYFDGASAPEDATVITFGPYDVYPIEMRLVPVADTIVGTVTDGTTGDPVEGVCVLYSLVPLGGDPLPPAPQAGGSCAGAFTGPTGQYAFGGFPGGPFEYVLQVSDPQGRYPTEYFEDATDIANATRVTAPATVDFVVGSDDGDGVTEPPGYDGNADGVPDDEQTNVSTVPTDSGALVTIAAADAGYPLSAVSATPPPAENPPPPGVALPAGLVGFTVTLPEGVGTADVAVVFPAGTAPTGYAKLQNGAWTDFTEHVTISGDVVTLHLVDGGPGDADGEVNGVIVDPGGATTRFGFGGFTAPTPGAVAKAGSTIPVKWSVVDRSGDPVNDPASFAGMTVVPCGGGTPVPVASPGNSGLDNTGDGTWQLNWKTDKAMAGQCLTLTVALAGDLGGGSVDVQLR